MHSSKSRYRRIDFILVVKARKKMMLICMSTKFYAKTIIKVVRELLENLVSMPWQILRTLSKLGWIVLG